MRNVSLHDLPHSFASLAVDADGSLAIIGSPIRKNYFATFVGADT